jgi:hypothetical protein
MIVIGETASLKVLLIYRIQSLVKRQQQNQTYLTQQVPIESDKAIR